MQDEEQAMLRMFSGPDDIFRGRAADTSPEKRRVLEQSALFQYVERNGAASLSLTDQGKEALIALRGDPARLVRRHIDPEKEALIRRAHGLTQR